MRVNGSGPAFPAVYAVGDVLDVLPAENRRPSFRSGHGLRHAESAMWRALGHAAIERMEAEERQVGEWPPRALALTRPDHSTTATRQQVGVGGSRLHPAYLPPPDPGKIGPLDPLPTFGAGLGHSLPKLPPLAGPASAVGTTLPLYAGGYGGALPPGPGLDHGVEYPDAHYPPWASGTPPTDITEPWVPGFYNARDDLTKISFSSMPPLLCIIHAWQRPKWLRPAGFL
ncbi:unnamed protein product [Durusdinium trenchii]|uniref:Uncharacterized protein n=2 Tax=Durusdinium trenchii TaxID=1381693 RepID=A0ABP0PF92_9DINO